MRSLVAEEVEVRDVPGYEGLYVATSDGKVVGLKTGKTLKESHNKGYTYVKLYKDAVGKPIRVHRIIASTFLPNPDNKDQVNHKNGVKDDNRVQNLEWATQSENQKHAYRTGLDKPRPWIGVKKPVVALDEHGNVMKEFDSITDAAEQLGLNISNICNACHGRIKRTGGFRWRLVSEL